MDCGGGLLRRLGLLGYYVSSRPPGRIDVAALDLQGKGVALAAVFTLLGRWYAVALIAIAAFAFALAFGDGVRSVAVVAGSQLLSQGAIGALITRVSSRAPDNWFIFQEPDTSYPSGHAATAVIFYLALAVLLSRANVSQRSVALAGMVGLGTCVAGLPWSRLALGAHYLTDVGGGLLFGAGWLCVLVALAYRVGYVH